MNHLVKTSEALAALLTDQNVQSMLHAVPSFPAIVSIEEDEVVAVVGLSEFYEEEGQVIADVSRTLEWYTKTFTEQHDDPGTLNLLTRAQTFLVRKREDLGRIVGHAQASAKAAEYRRRSFRDTLILAYRASGSSTADATARSRVETKHLDQEHTDSIEYYTRVRAILDSLDATLIAISQERKRLALDYERAHLTN